MTNTQPTPNPTKQRLEAFYRITMTSSKETCYHTPWENRASCYIRRLVWKFLSCEAKCPLEACWCTWMLPIQAILRWVRRAVESRKRLINGPQPTLPLPKKDLHETPIKIQHVPNSVEWKKNLVDDWTMPNTFLHLFKSQWMHMIQIHSTTVNKMSSTCMEWLVQGDSFDDQL